MDPRIRKMLVRVCMETHVQFWSTIYPPLTFRFYFWKEQTIVNEFLFVWQANQAATSSPGKQGAASCAEEVRLKTMIALESKLIKLLSTMPKRSSLRVFPKVLFPINLDSQNSIMSSLLSSKKKEQVSMSKLE